MLSGSIRETLIEIAIIQQYRVGEIVVSATQKLCFIYLILSGTVNLNKNNRLKGKFTSGNIFGESSLFFEHSQRSSELMASSKAEIATFDIDEFKRIIGQNYREIFIQNMIENIISIGIDSNLVNTSKILSIAQTFEIKYLKKGEIAIPKTKSNKEYLYIVCIGEISSENNSYSSYQFIGFNNRNAKNLCELDYAAKSDTILAELPIKNIEESVMVSIPEIVSDFQRINMLSSLYLFNNIDRGLLSTVTHDLPIKSYTKNEKIFTDDSFDNNIYILFEGSAAVLLNKTIIFKVKNSGTFGESCMTLNKRNIIAVANPACKCYILKCSILENIRNDAIYKRIQRIQYFETDVALSELNIICKINLEKSFKNEFIVQSSISKSLYMVETIEKISIQNYSKFNLLTEKKEVLLRIQSQYIPRLIKTFSDDYRVYFIYEYLSFEHLDKLYKQLNEQAIKYVVLFLSRVLGYLSEKNIIHRDLCPENILVDSKGQLWLHNFSVSKIFKDRAFTNVGNPFYRAKEAILGRGFTKASDY